MSRYPDIIRIISGGLPLTEEQKNLIADAIDEGIRQDHPDWLPLEGQVPLPENIAGTREEIIREKENKQ